MKVIELLIKMTNNEKVPKKIKLGNEIAEWNEETKDYFFEFYAYNKKYKIGMGSLLYGNQLNNEIEIIEEE